MPTPAQDDEALQRICRAVLNESIYGDGPTGAFDFACAVARRYAATVGVGEWRDIASVPEGVEVIVRGGKTVFGDSQRGSSVTIVDDRADLYRPDGTLRPSSPTMWHPAPAPPSR